MKHSHNQLKDALEIATKELRACYTDGGIIAGTHHFTDYWARDGFFAAFGSLAIGDQQIVERMLETFYKHQRADGLIPYRVMRGPVTLGKYQGKPTFYDQPKPTYRLRGMGNEILDGTTLTLLLTAKLGLKNFSIVKKYSPKIKIALSYLKKREQNGLLYDGVMSEWNDSALKFGNLLYSNIIYLQMFNLLSQLTYKSDSTWHKDLILKKNEVSKSLRKKLWTGKFFADWHDYKRHDFFYPFGNCLAVAWGLTTNMESKSILKQCKKVIADFTLETNSPKYPFWRIDPFQQIAGMGDYQNNSLLWWQPGLSYIAALKKMGLKKEVKKVMNRVVKKVCKDNGVYECYLRSGSPVKRLLYTSEKPFAWGSGMLLWALS